MSKHTLFSDFSPYYWKNYKENHNYYEILNRPKFLPETTPEVDDWSNIFCKKCVVKQKYIKIIITNFLLRLLSKTDASLKNLNWILFID